MSPRDFDATLGFPGEGPLHTWDDDQGFADIDAIIHEELLEQQLGADPEFGFGLDEPPAPPPPAASPAGLPDDEDRDEHFAAQCMQQQAVAIHPTCGDNSALGDGWNQVAPRRGHRHRQRAAATLRRQDGHVAILEEVHGFGLLTINGSSWSTAKEVILQTSQHIRVVLVQETKLRGEQIDEQSATMHRLGWASAWEPAEVTALGGLSAGVAILVRGCHGLRAPQTVVPHRALKVTVDLDSDKALTVMTLYGYEGEGMTTRQAQLLRAVGERAQDSEAVGLIFVVRGDWNLTPSQLCKARVCQSMGAHLHATQQITCKQTRQKGKVLDYFLASRRLGSTVVSTKVWQRVDVRPHRPVCLELDPGWLEVTTTKLVASPKLPKSRAIGPTRKPPC